MTRSSRPISTPWCSIRRMNNLVALTSNKPGFRSVLVNGRPVKSVNQFYNKRKAELQKQLGHTGTTKRMEHMTNKAEQAH